MLTESAEVEGEGEDTAPSERQFRRMRRGNRWLFGLVVVQAIAISFVAGWFLGRRQDTLNPFAQCMPGVQVIQASHVNCPWALPESKRHLVKGILCPSGNEVFDCHCDYAHSMKRFILELMRQGRTDDDIKAALLRRYGEQALSGRKW